jgi:erythromycin esterase
MATHGMVNVGQLVRDRHDDAGVVIVGFGTHHGTVIAADEWGAPMERMRVPAPRPGSWEDICHRENEDDKLMIFSDEPDGGVPGLERPRDHRAIGVVYAPRNERWGNYVPSILPRRYDAFLYVDATRGVDPLHMPVRVGEEPPETYPSGM